MGVPHIVVAFRMPPGGITPGPEGSYLARARSMCARGEALGGRLVAWSAALLAIAWDEDSMEEAILLATSIREEALDPTRAWAAGVAEGELEPLAPDGARMQLAWGAGLLSAASLARIAKAGEVLVDGDVRALRAGQLALQGARAATDAGQRVRGWKLDLDHPWRRHVEPLLAGADATDRYVIPPVMEDGPDLAATTQEVEVIDFLSNDSAVSEVLQIVEGVGARTQSAPPSSRERGSPLAERLRSLQTRRSGAEAVEALSQLRRARADADVAGPGARCQTALALAMALAMSGRAEEALLEVLDALARAREIQNARAVGACLALLAKLYAGVGRGGEAQALREAAGVG